MTCRSDLFTLCVVCFLAGAGAGTVGLLLALGATGALR